MSRVLNLLCHYETRSIRIRSLRCCYLFSLTTYPFVGCDSFPPEILIQEPIPEVDVNDEQISERCEDERVDCQ